MAASTSLSFAQLAQQTLGLSQQVKASDDFDGSCSSTLCKVALIAASIFAAFVILPALPALIIGAVVATAILCCGGSGHSRGPSWVPIPTGFPRMHSGWRWPSTSQWRSPMTIPSSLPSSEPFTRPTFGRPDGHVLPGWRARGTHY